MKYIIIHVLLLLLILSSSGYSQSNQDTLYIELIEFEDEEFIVLNIDWILKFEYKNNIKILVKYLERDPSYGTNNPQSNVFLSNVFELLELEDKDITLEGFENSLKEYYSVSEEDSNPWRWTILSRIAYNIKRLGNIRNPFESFGFILKVKPLNSNPLLIAKEEVEQMRSTQTDTFQSQGIFKEPVSKADTVSLDSRESAGTFDSGYYNYLLSGIVLILILLILIFIRVWDVNIFNNLKPGKSKKTTPEPLPEIDFQQPIVSIDNFFSISDRQSGGFPDMGRVRQTLPRGWQKSLLSKIEKIVNGGNQVSDYILKKCDPNMLNVAEKPIQDYLKNELIKSMGDESFENLLAKVHGESEGEKMIRWLDIADDNLQYKYIKIWNIINRDFTEFEKIYGRFLDDLKSNNNDLFMIYNDFLDKQLLNENIEDILKFFNSLYFDKEKMLISDNDRLYNSLNFSFSAQMWNRLSLVLLYHYRFNFLQAVFMNIDFREEKTCYNKIYKNVLMFCDMLNITPDHFEIGVTKFDEKYHKKPVDKIRKSSEFHLRLYNSFSRELKNFYEKNNFDRDFIIDVRSFGFTNNIGKITQSDVNLYYEID